MPLSEVYRILKKLLNLLRPGISNLLRKFLIRKRVHFSPQRYNIDNVP